MAKKKKKTRYTQKKLSRRNARFRILYALLLVLLAFGLYEVYIYIDKSLTAYEAAQPSHVVNALAEMFTQRRFDDVYAYEDETALAGETREAYAAYADELTKDAWIEYKEVFSKEAGVRQYTVTANGKSFASFSIRKSGQVKDCGLLGKVDLYEPGAVSTILVQPVTYEVTIPEAGALYVNGEVLTADAVVQSGIKIFASGHLPDALPSTDLCVYRFTRALGAPEFYATDANGERYTLEETAPDTYRYVFPYQDALLKEEYEPHIVEAAKAICKYTTENTTITRVLKYMVPSSSAANYISNMDSMWLTKADSYTFSDIVTENYATFSDTLFCCDVRFTYTTVSKRVENAYPVAYRFYYTKQADGWLIYDFEFL